MKIQIILALACSALVSPAQVLNYSLLSSDGPSPRFDGTIAYDPAARRLFMFGGQDSAPKNDLWSYSLDQRRWTEIQPSGAKPPERFGHTLVFDPVRRRLIVFGGQARGFFSDVWAYDIARESWSQLARDEAGPSRRYGHSAIYESARDRMVISHGFTNAGRFDDTWAFDLGTNSWRDISPPNNRPLRRCLHHAAYDPGAGQMYLYGGCASGLGPCPLGDLWSFDLNTNRWTDRSGSQPAPPRQHYAMAFDTGRNRLVIFGGSGTGLLNDTWEFDRAGLWCQPPIGGAAPAPRERHEAVFAPDQGAIFFFGGSTNPGLTNELWMLTTRASIGRPEISQNGVVNAFSGESGPIAPGELVSIYGTGIGPIEGISFAFDPLTGALPTSGPGVSVNWNGIPAPLLFARSDQLNVQVPYELAGAEEANLVVNVLGSLSETIQIPVVRTRPGLFPRVWNQDGSLNSPGNPAAPGSIITMYGTGHGATLPASRTGAYPTGTYPEPEAPVVLQIGGRDAEILFRGQAPGTAGILQINARVPEGLNSGTIVLRVGAAASQAGVTVNIR